MSKNVPNWKSKNKNKKPPTPICLKSVWESKDFIFWGEGGGGGGGGAVALLLKIMCMGCITITTYIFGQGFYLLYLS